MVLSAGMGKGKAVSEFKLPDAAEKCSPGVSEPADKVMSFGSVGDDKASSSNSSSDVSGEILCSQSLGSKKSKVKRVTQAIVDT